MKPTKAERAARYFAAMANLGFTFEEANTLRRAERTLQRWGELECGDGNENCSWAIERDEKTDRPFMVRHYYGNGKTEILRWRVADREKGALRRVDAIMTGHPDLVRFHQTDPRGCALYVIRKADVPAGSSLDSVYTRGLACCI